MNISLIFKLLLLLGALILGFSSPYIFKTKNSPAEQAAEKVLKDNFNIDIDFSADK